MRHQECILVVDDDPFMRAFAEAVLLAAGFYVVLAANAVDGIESFQAKQPDLILLDFAMPGLGGPDALRAMALIADLPPVVVLSAWGSEDDRSAMRKLGASWLEKPVSSQALVSAVNDELAGQRARRPGVLTG